MQNKIGKKVLVTTSSWFMAPDGRQYKAVFGTLKAINTSQDTLGFSPNARHTNWYLEIGNMSIAGCQVQYLVQTDTCNTERVEDFTMERTEPRILTNCGRVAEMYERESIIYNADNL